MGARGREGASAGPTVPRTPPHRAWPQSPSWLVFILRHPAALSLARRAPTPGGARSSVTHAMRVTGLARRWTSGNHVRVQHHQHPPVGGRAHPAQNGETRRTRRGLSSVVGHEPRPARVTEPVRHTAADRARIKCRGAGIGSSARSTGAPVGLRWVGAHQPPHLR
eukprot:1689420-Prymnesium_polylepis.1